MDRLSLYKYFFFVKLGINNHIVSLVHKNHILNEILNKHVQNGIRESTD